MPIEIVIAPYDQLTRLINQVVSKHFYESFLTRIESNFNRETAIVDLIDHILTDAIYQNASDIHFEPLRGDYRVRLRIDGLLYQLFKPPAQCTAAIASRLKIISNSQSKINTINSNRLATFR